MLEKIIKNIIIQKDQAIGFDEFSQLALYHPEYGYYRSSAQKFGKGGDFVTAPELSPLFAQVLAISLQQAKGNGDILEFGAGSGALALQLLLTLEDLEALPQCYYILELSAELTKRQQVLIKKAKPHLFELCVWLDELPQNFSGVVIANEVLDALPVKRFIYHNSWQELGVGIKDNQLAWQNMATDIDLGFKPNAGYTTELNVMLKPWLKALYDCLDRAVVLIIDYGYVQKEYYHPQRTEGTLRCYYRHRASENPFIHIGKQDITASVNFSMLYKNALSIGFEHLGFLTQAHFLLNLGILELLEQLTDFEKIRQSQSVKQLLLPTAMGQTFKAIAFSKMTNIKLLGFNFGDLSHKL